MAENAGGANQNEVRVALVMDDKASETLNKVAAALAQVSGANAHANTEAKKTDGIWSQIKGTAVGTALGGAMGFAFHKGVEAVHKGVEEVKEAFSAGLNELEGQRSLAGILQMTDQSGSSWETINDKAILFKDSLEDIGIAAGVADDAIQDIFEGIASRSNKTALEVEALTEKVAYAGKAVRGGAGALSMGFQQMEMGMIRAKNPVVQLIAATHMLQGNAKSVAAQLQKMSPEKQLKIAEQAVERMGEKMKKAPPTWAGLLTSIKGVKEQTFEAVGVPLVQAVLPTLEKVKDFLVSNKDAITGFADRMVTRVLTMRDEFVNWGKTIWDTVNTANVREMLTDGAMALTKAFGLAFEAGKFFYGSVAGIVSTLGDVYKKVKENTITNAMNGRYGDVGKRIYLDSERDRNVEGAKDRLQYAQNPLIAKETQKWLEGVQDAQNQYIKAGGELSAEQIREFEVLQSNLDFARKQGEQAEGVVKSGSVDKFAQMYNDAARAHNVGVQYYMAKLLSGEDSLQDALIKSGVQLEGGLAELAKKMKDAVGVDKDKVEKFVLKVKGSGDKSSPVVNFNGGQTFNIKQDFRDQDPDRIAVIFRQDIIKAASSRVQSSRATAFGF